ncbi:hypothetical protein G9A89_010821 [Geosiphon pyriformis]|nr:hypothetical protein G9A89_010821 [Geosiphon pyriformis]
MRPDQYKQAQARKYQGKLRARGNSTAAKEAHEKFRNRHEKQRGFKSSLDSSEDEAGLESEKELDGTQKESFSRRRIQSNAHRYQEQAEQDGILANEDGIDWETKEFLDLINESDFKSFAPSSYFQFKEEKEWDSASTKASDGDEQGLENLMNVSFDDLESSLHSVSLFERLNLQPDLSLEAQEPQANINFAKPLVPRTVRLDLRKTFDEKQASPSIQTFSAVEKIENHKNSTGPQNEKIGKKAISNSSTSQPSPAIQLHKVSNLPMNTSPKSKPKGTISNLQSSKPSRFQGEEDIDNFLKSIDEVENKATQSQIKTIVGKNRGSSNFPNPKTPGFQSKSEIKEEDWLDDVLG